MIDYEGNAVRVGDRIELHPAHDLWMRGARFGTVRRLLPGDLAVVKMDHPLVKLPQRVSARYLRLVSARY
jgi:hypothetical protein